MTSTSASTVVWRKKDERGMGMEIEMEMGRTLVQDLMSDVSTILQNGHGYGHEHERRYEHGYDGIWTSTNLNTTPTILYE